MRKKQKCYNKRYKDMTADEKTLKRQYVTYYRNRLSVYDICNANWKGYTKARALHLTFSKQISLDQISTRLSTFRAALIKRGFTFFDERLYVKGIQPDTGRYHIHMLLFNVDNSISDKEYREVINEEWKWGIARFEKVRNIYKYVEYMISHLKPTNEQYINDRFVIRAVWNVPNEPQPADVTEIDDISDMIYNQSDVISEYKHKFSNSKTILFKPTADLRFKQQNE